MSLALPSSPSSRRRGAARRFGRLGIEQTALPPLPSPSPRSPPRRLAELQQDERAAFERDLRLRLAVNRDAHGDSSSLGALRAAVVRALDAAPPLASSESCFSDAKALARQLEPSLPFLAQFLLELVQSIEQLAVASLRREAAELAAPAPASPVSSASASSGSSHDEEEEAEQQQQQQPSSPSPPAATTSTTFRTTLRSRRFPPSRVPRAEAVTTECAYTPFELAPPARHPDPSALELHGRDAQGSARWTVVRFPRARPRLCADEVAAFVAWATAKQREGAAVVDSPDAIRADLARRELLCFEFSRLVFDRCPTTARLLHGLFAQLVALVTRALALAAREAEIMAQRHKNVQLELSRLLERRARVAAALQALERALSRRQQLLLRERERIVRQRKRLNQLLCADQVLLRGLAGLLHHAQDLADDLTHSQSLHPDAQLGLGAAHVLPVAEDARFSGVERLLQVVLHKYAGLPGVPALAAAWRPRDRLGRADAGDEGDADPVDAESDPPVIVVDLADVRAAADDLKALLARLQRVVSAKTPDSAVGWDAQELWDQALFIPPPEEIQDLERDVTRLCAQVEHALLQRRRHAHAVLRCDAAAQTELSACVPRGQSRSRSPGRGRQPRWPRPVDARPEPAASPADATAAALDAIERWTRRRSCRVVAPSRPKTAPAAASALAASTISELHQELLDHVLPAGFRAALAPIPPDYAPQQLSLADVHTAISYVLNGIWLLVQDDAQRPVRFSTALAARRVLPLEPVHAYVLRVYLQHFRAAEVATARLLDLLGSANRLDTQSCKVHLFARLLGLPGVPALSWDGGWFVLKALHVLQRCCAQSGHYFLLDAAGDNEFVPQASASEAIGLLFAAAPNEVLKRMRLKLAGLASVYGAVWIPAYNILTLLLDEWAALQDALRRNVEERLLEMDHEDGADDDNNDDEDDDERRRRDGGAAATDAAAIAAGAAGPRQRERAAEIPSFERFLGGFEALELPVSRLDAVRAYRELLRESAAASAPRFQQLWVQLVVRAVNAALHQTLQPLAISPLLVGGSASHSASGPGVHLGAVPEALRAANRQLAAKFLRMSWEHLKPAVIRQLDARLQDVGLQVRLVQQMEAAVADAVADAGAGAAGWRSLQQLVSIAYDPCGGSGHG
ncbi:hypothetical protein P43SY_003401 [Pythium insidiosum]|uniref:Uncharacterized protein n=1 Tax=Pythium insidiosum TaxID=114742 RepID=A0AAD5LGE6_PYTIN|nr:hypothetical protein P43SY_003401 [Pythium insidiosum]